MKARCKNAGAHRQYEVGRVYNYHVINGVCDLDGAMNVSANLFNVFFDKVE